MREKIDNGIITIFVALLTLAASQSFAQHSIDIKQGSISSYEYKSHDTIPYKVRKGDNLSGLAYRYKTTVSKIKRANNLNRDQVFLGETLKIPYNTKNISGKDSYISYTIGRGDSLTAIASNYKTDVRSIQIVNNLARNQVRIGQKILIPYNKKYTSTDSYRKDIGVNTSSKVAQKPIKVELKNSNKKDYQKVIEDKYLSFLEKQKKIQKDKDKVLENKQKQPQKISKKPLKPEQKGSKKTITKDKNVKKAAQDKKKDKEIAANSSKLGNSSGKNHSKNINAKSPSTKKITTLTNKDTKDEQKSEYKNIEKSLKNNLAVKDKKEIKTAEAKISNEKTVKTVNKESKDKYISYIVKSGDNISVLAEKYNTTSSEIRELNGLKGNRINIGQKLKIPKMPPSQYITYRVQSGDSLSVLAQNHGMTTKQVMELNGLKSKQIVIGQRLKFPNKVEKQNAKPQKVEKKMMAKAQGEVRSQSPKEQGPFQVTSNNELIIDKPQDSEHTSNEDEAASDKSNKTDDKKSNNDSELAKAGEQPSVKEAVKKTNENISESVSENKVATQDKKQVKEVKKSLEKKSEPKTVAKNKVIEAEKEKVKTEVKIAKTKTPDTVNKDSRYVNYIVKSGDSISVLAEKYNTTSSEIRELNGLKGNRINIGQKLKIPKMPPSQYITYRVQSGDSLSVLAQNHGMTTSELMVLNGLEKKQINIGQILRFPRNNIDKYDTERHNTESSAVAKTTNNTVNTDKKTSNEGTTNIIEKPNESVSGNASGNKIAKQVKPEDIMSASKGINTDNKISKEKAITQKVEQAKEVTKITEPIKDTKKAITKDQYTSHVVKSGDTLSELAEEHGITTKQLMELNSLTSKQVNIGQSLKVPAKELENENKLTESDKVIAAKAEIKEDGKTEASSSDTKTESVKNASKKAEEISKKDRTEKVVQVATLDQEDTAAVKKAENDTGAVEPDLKLAADSNAKTQEASIKKDTPKLNNDENKEEVTEKLVYEPEGGEDINDEVTLAQLLTIENSNIPQEDKRYENLMDEQVMLASNNDRYDTFAQRPPATLQPETPTTRASDVEGIVNIPDEIDLGDFVRTISEITGESYILDEKLKGKKVTIVTPEGGFNKKNAIRLFEAILLLNGFTVYKKGVINVITETRNIKQQDIEVQTGKIISDPSDRFVTQIIPLKNISAQDISNTLKPLVSREGDIVVHTPLNTLIIVETRSNLERLINILNNIDKEKDIVFVKIYNSEASDIAAMLTEIFGGARVSPISATDGDRDRRRRTTRRTAARTAATGQTEIAGFKIITDERTNSLIVIAFPDDIPKIKAAIERLDVEVPEPEHGIYVIRLKNGDAEQIVGVLNSLITGAAASGRTSRGFEATREAAAQRRLAERAPGAQQPTTAAGAVTEFTLEDIRITADVSTNSIIVVGSRREFEAIKRVVDELDIRRKQVFVEAAILEVSLDQLRAVGTNLSIGFTFDDDNLGFGGTNLPGVPSLLGAAANSEETVSLVGSLTGMFLGVVGEEVDVDGSGPIPPIPSFTALFQALTSITDVNILSTPSIATTDNEEAEIVVADVIPFPTGSTVGDAGVTVQTIDREPVGIRLAITPQIGDGDFLHLELQTEVSSVRPAPPDLNTEDFGIATTTRTASSSVVVKDGQTIVIGGLVQDREGILENKVPGLGSVPVLGNFFKFKEKSSSKINLMILLTPRIVEDEKDMKLILEDRQKRNMLLQQRGFDTEGVY